MCGIFAVINHDDVPLKMIEEGFQNGKHRGPEFSKLEDSFKENKIIFGFHRLAINGLNEASNQPFMIDNIVLICNGEIYNYKELYTYMGVLPKTGSDCEVIIHLYNKYGIQQTLNMLDGVFSFVLYDILNNKIYVARDPLGVRPLYQFINQQEDIFGFASELKCLHKMYYNTKSSSSINQFTPGTYSSFEIILNKWHLLEINTPYFKLPFSHSFLCGNMYSNISKYLNEAVIKRCLTTERPIACLLSGGLDSSLIAALVNNFYNSHHMPNKLETYSIGLQHSEDLKYAKIVADYLGTNHTEIIVTEEEMFRAIPEVIHNIESYDTTTIRASIGNYLLGKYIRKNSEAKVIFNGDGSDELLGGYLYMNKCPDNIEFDKETRTLLTNIHLFDVLRSDKCISSHGLEPRTPFLDRNFVSYILSIPPHLRNHNNENQCEKYILRKSFTREYFQNHESNPILPDIILWRKKEAFSDGVSSHGHSLFQILQEQISEYFNTIENTTAYTPCINTEKQYYTTHFNESYPNCLHLLPYLWMPKYTDATDPSARTLTFYETTTV
jgi:asparagine synthase (glutamine-hydrolysing)